ncbi:MAG: hypothetical protein AAGB05_16920 [Pseudomonadota bacterium]
MAKLPADNPFVDIVTHVLSVEDKLDFVISFVTNLGKSVLTGLQTFSKNIVKHLSSGLSQYIGKAVADGMTKAIDRLADISGTVHKLTQDAKKLAIKIRATIEKSVKEPEKVFKAVKGMVARLAKLFRQAFSYIRSIATLFNPITVALKLIETYKRILQVIFKWIGQVTPLLAAVKRATATVKKVTKTLQAELKNVTQLVKETNALKAA